MGTSTGLFLGSVTGGLFAIGMIGSVETQYSVPRGALNLNPDKAMKVTIKEYDPKHTGRLNNESIFYILDKNGDGIISPEERQAARRLSDAYTNTGKAMIGLGTQIKTVADNGK